VETLADLPACPKAVSDRLRSRALKLRRPFYALRDVSFAIPAGESLGIIGRNGSGKSTLLQMLAGTLTPTSGRCAVRGRVAALLELGSGFNPDFTGRENVFLQAALAGVPPSEAKAHFDEVADFAGIDDFIEQPVKTYSSGMMVRLAFATQTILRPEVFIVDEALAVGDVFFQAKCSRFFRERLADGMSLLFVSHDLTSVKALCRQALVLDKGQAVFFGDSAAAVSHYHQLHSGHGTTRPVSAASVESPETGGTIPPESAWRNWPKTSEIGSRDAEIIYCRIGNAAGAETRSFSPNESFWIEIFVRGQAQLNQLQFSIEISDRHNRVLYGVSTVHLGMDYETIDAGEVLIFRTVFDPRLGTGDYLIDVALGLGDRGDGAPLQHIHRVAHIATVSFRHGAVTPPFLGPADLGAKIQVRSTRRAMAN